jgi:radical SAM protein with 4Fe4S-binding SPASM domain
MQKFYHNIGLWEKRQFFAENCPQSQKIVIITSTPDEFVKKICQKCSPIKFCQNECMNLTLEKVAPKKAYFCNLKTAQTKQSQPLGEFSLNLVTL